MKQETKPTSHARGLTEPAAPSIVANDGLGELPHAYAVVMLPGGRAVAVHLQGVTAKQVDRISTNEAAESLPFATARCRNAMDKRTRQRLWGAK